MLQNVPVRPHQTGLKLSAFKMQFFRQNPLLNKLGTFSSEFRFQTEETLHLPKLALPIDIRTILCYFLPLVLSCSKMFMFNFVKYKPCNLCCFLPLVLFCYKSFSREYLKGVVPSKDSCHVKT